MSSDPVPNPADKWNSWTPKKTVQLTITTVALMVGIGGIALTVVPAFKAAQERRAQENSQNIAKPAVAASQPN